MDTAALAVSPSPSPGGGGKPNSVSPRGGGQQESSSLLGLPLEHLTARFTELGEKSFRAKQTFRWLHQELQGDFGLMSDLASVTRSKLSALYATHELSAVRDTTASDGTRKWLFDVGNANAVEAVYIPEDDRGTLCISSQAGCALDCAFCATGKQGFNRNLTAAEIVGQLWTANRQLRAAGITRPQDRHPITNVVMMGMGEPMANFEPVVNALQIMLDDHAYGLSRRRVTVSTSGLVPQIDMLRERCPVALAVSLHAPNDALRDTLVPINKRYPLKELLAACNRYLDNAPRDFITFEYVMLDGVNDQPQHVDELLDIAHVVPCKFNLIPFNPFPGSEFKTSPRSRVLEFQRRLGDGGVVTTIRKTRGDDIAAACGQLAGQVKDRTRRTSIAAQLGAKPVTFHSGTGRGRASPSPRPL